MIDPTDRAGEPLDQLVKFAAKVHYEAVGANALFSVEHWKHNAGIDWPDIDDGSYEAFENCVHPDCKMVREGVERLRSALSSRSPEIKDSLKVDASSRSEELRRLHIRFNVATSRAGGTPIACDGADCAICAVLLAALRQPAETPQGTPCPHCGLFGNHLSSCEYEKFAALRQGTEPPAASPAPQEPEKQP